ncbi:Flagellar motor switch protein FliG [Paraburkholderia hiiakae]|uniref:Flagellar motor switch protein FliG n=2 Tax=Paraburkholderia hiiakae TaxID=1081782 RepID=A0ABM8NJI4_9BURK|nr:flagellar motor switch protein FliG [Paraburkholderia hiiakae]CAD6528491.1 Flagellar motor switch protein FliG [Paraburkholderia hiiakae]
MASNGIERAALLLMVLGEEHAADVFRALGPREVQKIGSAMAKIASPSRDELSEILEQFNLAAEELGGISVDTDEYLRSVLVRALGDEKGNQLIGRILQGSDTSGIEGLKWLDSSAIAELVKNEHPQIIATILVHLDHDQAAEIVATFPERLRNDVLLRIAVLEGIQPFALRELDNVLKDLLAGGGNLKRSAMGGVRAAAEILNYMTGGQEQSALENVKAYDAELAQAIIDEMFTFDNLLDLDNPSIQLLIKEIPGETLIIALKGAQGPLRQKFLNNMSRRAAELFAEDLGARGPVRVSEVEEQQRSILQVVRNLAESGQIVIGKNAEDAFVE